ncbi:hypothetical protein ACFQ1M_09815 [Sungkyunkwania multivorans]|uniref:Uncharacterized protein n=1 Tax=Sungkyunkwania multivorans TaxID=1173618 RepID=A0ABW3D0Y0_9FLAO
MALDIPLDKIRQFPLHEQHLYQNEYVTLEYKFKPTSNLDVQEYMEYLKGHFKRKYDAYSIEVGILQQQLGNNDGKGS